MRHRKITCQLGPQKVLPEGLYLCHGLGQNQESTRGAVFWPRLAGDLGLLDSWRYYPFLALFLVGLEGIRQGSQQNKAGLGKQAEEMDQVTQITSFFLFPALSGDDRGGHGEEVESACKLTVIMTPFSLISQLWNSLVQLYNPLLTKYLYRSYLTCQF